jgi:peptidoglycan hydrolase CwlO-like protein
MVVAGVPLLGAFPSARPAGADQIATLQAQAAQISQTLVREQLQIGAYQQQYSVASAQVQRDAAVISQTNAQLSADQQHITADTARIRSQAIRDYMNAGSSTLGADAALLTGGGNTAIAQVEYQTIASGNIATEIDQLNTSRQTLQTHQAALQQQEASDRSAVNQQAVSLARANTTQQQLAAEQGQVTGQLTAAVAQQQAAQAAAAAAAVKASEAAAAQKAAQKAQAASSAQAANSPVATSAAPSASPAAGGTAPVAVSVAPPAPSGAGATSDPPLPPFLICVRQVESGGDYGAVSPDGQYMGAFQFSQPTWNSAAQAAGLPGLVNVPPNTASRASQDTVAITLYNLDGQQPWLDSCHS